MINWLKSYFRKGWFKSFTADGCRDAMRESYQKHHDLARKGLLPAAVEPHYAGLYGALGSRYRLRGLLPRDVTRDVILRSELAPFLAMSEEDAVEALAEYVLWQERPTWARTEWLAQKINETLNGPKNNEVLLFAGAAFINKVAWYKLLTPRNKEIFINEAKKFLE